MNLMTAMDVSATGMVAERVRLNVISMNLANAKTTRTETGTPYQRRTVIFRSRPMGQPFQQFLNEQLGEQIRGVEVVRIEKRGEISKRSMIRVIQMPMSMAMCSIPTSTWWKKW